MWCAPCNFLSFPLSRRPDRSGTGVPGHTGALDAPAPPRENCGEDRQREVLPMRRFAITPRLLLPLLRLTACGKERAMQDATVQRCTPSAVPGITISDSLHLRRKLLAERRPRPIRGLSRE